MFRSLDFSVAAGAGAQSWNSQLLPLSGGKFTPQTVSFAGRNWSLDDYSYAGYFLGARSLGSVICNIVDITASGDITQPVQAAVTAVGNAGGGIVRIPAGTFSMSAPVAVPFSNVSIEGAGSGQTLINVAANYGTDNGSTDGLFSFGRALGAPVNNGWINKGPVVANLPAAVLRGDMQVAVDSAAKIAPGDWIVIQQLFWPALVANNSASPHPWPANQCCEFSFTYLRQVTGIAGNQVSLDAPIPWTLDPANNPVRVRQTDGQMKENSGVKGLTIRFANNVLSATGRPHGSGVYFEGVRNGWVYDVQVLNFPRYGIYLSDSARITVLDCWVQTAQDKGGGGYGYGFLASPAQNVLIKRSHGEDNRHNFITSHPQTSVVVLTQNVSINETEPDDTHYAFEQAILWDKHTQLNGGAIEMLNRGDESGSVSAAYETLASGAIWNFYGDGARNHLASLNGALYLKPSPDGQLVVVGMNGAHAVFDNSQGRPFVPGQQMPAAAGLQVGNSAGALQNVLYEGLYQTGLQPASLFETQLANRLGTVPADWIDACGSSPTLNPGGIANAASFAAGPLSPGEIVTLFGAGLGPPVLTTAAVNGFGLVDTALAGTRVLFDGIPAPLVYTRADTVSAVTPYALDGKAATVVQVEYFGQRSPGATFPVAATSPGIFKLGNAVGGVGIWALNQDGTLNSPANPAVAGSVVVLFATGAGQTTPAGIDGSVAVAPYPAPKSAVSVTIGGVNADLQYAGAAPSEIAGLLQINAVVPAGLAASDTVALVLSVGGTAAPQGTLAIR
ncbi:MAG: hypothetical protein JST11_28500 [Acidobacteria bacterium]|nr:hypothetical protein [Acidobacteriota bacterium]